MTNTQAPFGFRYMGLVDGSPPNFGIAPGKMAYNASASYRGDSLVFSAGKLASGTTTGGTGAATAGVAWSFSWVSTAQQRRVWMPYYPGNDSVSNADVDIYYVNNPGAIFEVQSSGSAITQANVGSFINFAVGSGGNTYSGQSSYSADQATINASQGVLPFAIYQIEQAPRTDPASSYNLIRVRFATLSI